MAFYIYCPQVEICPVHSFDAVGVNMHQRFVGSTIEVFLLLIMLSLGLGYWPYAACYIGYIYAYRICYLFFVHSLVDI